MDTLLDFLNWAWARPHNPLSWYIRPLFILPFCYFAYRKSVRGIVVTLMAATSSIVAWSFYVAGTSAWVIVPAVAAGNAVCAGVLTYAYWRTRFVAL